MSEHKFSCCGPWTSIERDGEGFPINVPEGVDLIVTNFRQLTFACLTEDRLFMEADKQGYFGLRWEPTAFITKEDLLQLT